MGTVGAADGVAEAGTGGTGTGSATAAHSAAAAACRAGMDTVAQRGTNSHDVQSANGAIKATSKLVKLNKYMSVLRLAGTCNLPPYMTLTCFNGGWHRLQLSVAAWQGGRATPADSNTPFTVRQKLHFRPRASKQQHYRAIDVKMQK